MGGRSQRSKKRSAANSRSTRPRKAKSLHFFVDECVSQRHVPDVLRAAGHIVHLQRDIVPSGTHDVEWLPIVGKRKWILITKDEKIRKRAIEMHAYLGAQVRGFVMTAAGEMRGVDQRELIAKALPAIVRLVSKRPAPFIANITASGYVELIDVRKYL